VRVLHVIPSLSPRRGGPTIALKTMVRSLAAEGLNIEVATTDDDMGNRLSVATNGPTSEDGARVWYFRRQGSFYTFSWPMTRWLERSVGQFDVVHVHALFSYASLPAAFFARRHKVPYIVRPMGHLNEWGMTHRRRMLKPLSYSLIERRILKRAALIHFTSEDERIDAMRLGLTNRSVVLPLGVDAPPTPSAEALGAFKVMHRLSSGPHILFLSRLDAKKGLDLLLPAFRSLLRSRPSAVLLIAGSGSAEFEANARTQAQELGLDEKNVRWLGHADGVNKSAAFAASDIFVLPSYSENFGVSVVEAMAMGLPVLVSDQVGIAAEIRDADAGRVVPCDVDALGRALNEMVSSSDLRGVGERARRLAAERFSAAQSAERLVDLYSEVASSARQSRSADNEAVAAVLTS
jgi:glycosyltransferase involved in cell wall biosynthesis